MEEQSGHYLALDFLSDPEADSVTVELVGGKKGPVTLDEDMNCVFLITEETKGSIKVIATKSGQTATETFDISGLILG